MNFFGVVGDISRPDHLSAYGDLSGSDGTGGGLIGLLSNVIKIVMVVGGIWSFINLIMAGFTYITSGDNAEELGKAHQRIYMSLIGLALIVGSFAIAGIIGFILYGDPSAILSPEIYGPGQG